MRKGAVFLLTLMIIILIFNIKIDTYEPRTIKIKLNNETINKELGTTIKEIGDQNILLANDPNERLYDGQIIQIVDDTSLISINNADLDQLMTLPGIGEKTANKIIEYRNNNGSFKYLEEIKEVKGIGEKKFEKIKDLIRL